MGDSGVGKSSLLMRFATGEFSELSATIGTFTGKLFTQEWEKVSTFAIHGGSV